MSDDAKLPLSSPPLDLDFALSEAQLAALLERTRQKWKHHGEIEPYWSVNAQAAFRVETIEANRHAFHRSGLEDAATLLAILQRHGFNRAASAHLCDFGCGVGRVSLPLASVFERVTGCDISSTHLQVGAREAARLGLENIAFSQVSTGDFGMNAPFDVWYSHLVLQHNPPPVIALILQRMFSQLAPGGLAVFQVPTYRLGYRFSATEALVSPASDEDFEIHPIAQPAVFDLARRAGCVVLEVREDLAIWPPSVAISNTFVFGRPYPTNATPA